MTKPELIEAVVKAAKLRKKEAAGAVDAVFDSIASTLKKGQKVQVVGFGTFEVRRRKARTGRNPRTQETIKIGPSKTPAFRAGKQLRAAVSGRR